MYADLFELNQFKSASIFINLRETKKEDLCNLRQKNSHDIQKIIREFVAKKN